MCSKRIYLLHFVLWSLWLSIPTALGEVFEIKNNKWYHMGEPVLLRSGDLHYSRVPPSLWEDRIVRLVAMGLNTIQTYVPWNFHELDFEGNVTDFSGERDLLLFLDLAAKYNLFVLLRPGPYICAEWDLGGLPARLLANDEIKIRSNDYMFLKEVRRWFNTLLPKLKDKLIFNGGPIIAVQVENEFGFWGNATKNKDDKEYLEFLVHTVREHLGENIILYTTDYANEDFMSAGSLIGGDIISLGDFGPFIVNSHSINMVDQLLEVQKKLNVEGKSPPMCTEFYTGWLTHWGQPMARTSSKFLASSLDYMLYRNTSVNLYMAAGGTNFGFWSGANYDGEIHFDITSYDYNAPLSESGMHNFGIDGIDKYDIIRQTFQKYFSSPKIPEPTSLQMFLLENVTCTKLPLNLIKWIKENVEGINHFDTMSMEELGQRFGLTLYSTTIKEPFASLFIGSVHDRAQVFVDGNKIQDIARGEDLNYTLSLRTITERNHTGQKEKSHVLDILVENLGRVNFGYKMNERKGLIGSVKLDGLPLNNWNHFPMEFMAQDLFKLKDSILKSELSLENDGMEQRERNSNGFYHGSFRIFEDFTPGGTYIILTAFCRGYVWINDRLLGRYWTLKGPQISLYAPGEFFNFSPEGDNSTLQNHLIILEMESTCHNAERRNVTFSATLK